MQKKIFIILIFFLSFSVWMCNNNQMPVEADNNSIPAPTLSLNAISMPANAVITSAKLFLYVRNVRALPQNVNVHMVTEDWLENQVTWTNRMAAVAWNTPGGTYDDVFNPIASFIPNSTGWTPDPGIDITDIVKAWQSGTPNYGLLLEQGNTIYVTYFSREYLNGDFAPYIIITLDDGSQLGPEKAIADAYIWELNNTGVGTGNILYTGTVSEYEKRSLIKFDLTFTGEPSCETAYAFGGRKYATCFSDIIDEDSNFNNWGWSNGPLAEEGDYTFDIYAGAGQCDLNKGTLVGKLLVDYSSGTANITYEILDGFTMDEIHLYVGNDILPRKKKGDFTVAPGQYPIKDENPTDGKYTVGDLSGDIYIVAHAVVCGDYKKIVIPKDKGPAVHSRAKKKF